MSNDALTIRRVANGWIIVPSFDNPTASSLTHVAITAEAVADYVMTWAMIQQVAAAADKPKKG